MLDEHYNPNHCEDCKELCSICMDAYKTEGGLKPVKVGTFCTRLDYDPKGYCVMRYAQRNMMRLLLKMMT